MYWPFCPVQSHSALGLQLLRAAALIQTFSRQSCPRHNSSAAIQGPLASGQPRHALRTHSHQHHTALHTASHVHVAWLMQHSPNLSAVRVITRLIREPCPCPFAPHPVGATSSTPLPWGAWHAGCGARSKPWRRLQHRAQAGHLAGHQRGVPSDLDRARGSSSLAPPRGPVQ